MNENFINLLEEVYNDLLSWQEIWRDTTGFDRSGGTDDLIIRIENVLDVFKETKEVHKDQLTLF